MSEAAAVVHRLGERREDLAVAESLTGGLLAAQLTAVPGASAVFTGAVVAYATTLKAELLGVPTAVLAEHGAVSAACAEAMASGVRRLAGSSYGLATTGVAGPARQEGHPVGTVFIAVAGPGGVHSRRLALAGDRGDIRAATCAAVLGDLLSLLG